MREKIICIAGILAILSGLAMGVAQAGEDGKLYPGSMCRVTQGSGAVYNYSAIGNISTTADLVIECPNIRDDKWSTKNGWVKVADQHSSRAVECTLFHVAASGLGFTIYSSGAPAASGGNSPYWQTLGFGQVSSSSWAHSYFSCKIPPREAGISWLSTYSMTEYSY